MRGLCIFLCLWASDAVAQEPAFSSAPTQSCLLTKTMTSHDMACIGLASLACIQAPGSGGGYAESFCYRAEMDFWDDRLNVNYQARLEKDADNPPVRDALRILQRDWITYRDAFCNDVFETWGEGTGRSPAFSECLMRTTATQALFLERGL